MSMPQDAPEPRLSHLYQEVILDHNKNPRNFKEIEQPSAYSHGYNPLCGDDYHLYVKLDGQGNLEDIGFKGSGCAISKASASIMTSMVKGKKLEEIAQLKDAFLELMTSDKDAKSYKDTVGRLVIFDGVREFPIRVKCATLIWHALADALADVK